MEILYTVSNLLPGARLALLTTSFSVVVLLGGALVLSCDAASSSAGIAGGRRRGGRVVGAGGGSYWAGGVLCGRWWLENQCVGRHVDIDPSFYSVKKLYYMCKCVTTEIERE